MNVLEKGLGHPLVLVPGLLGRWEYMRRTVDALAEVCRVITFSLADEPASGWRFDNSRGFDNFVDQIQTALDERGIARAAICGWSFGGLVALRFHTLQPLRTSAVIAISTPAPDWRLTKEQERSVATPWLFGPMFFLNGASRMRAELVEAIPERLERYRFLAEQAATFFCAPIRLSRMARRARMIEAAAAAINCAAVSAPTLLVAGEARLDRVVPVESTAKYLSLIRGSRLVTLEHTGHYGCVARSRAFASIVHTFLDGSRHAAA